MRRDLCEWTKIFRQLNYSRLQVKELSVQTHIKLCSEWHIKSFTFCPYWTYSWFHLMQHSQLHLLLLSLQLLGSFAVHLPCHFLLPRQLPGWRVQSSSPIWRSVSAIQGWFGVQWINGQFAAVYLLYMDVLSV